MLFLISFMSFSQIKGTISDEKGNSIPYAIVFEENTYNSTTTNELGKYELNVKTPGQHILLFQYLGYKTAKQIVEINQLTYFYRNWEYLATKLSLCFEVS